jgi:hypothetical protein
MPNKRMAKVWVVVGTVTLVAGLYGYTALKRAMTPGDRFQKAMAQRAKLCSQQPVVAGDTSCNILRLKPGDESGAGEAVYAHAIQLTQDVAQDVYRTGMTAKEYFQALCEKNAGEFIYRTVADVAGIVQLRPHPLATDHMLMHLYALEDPFGYSTEGEAGYARSAFVRPSRYRYLDTPAPAMDVRLGRARATRTTGARPDFNADSFEHLSEGPAGELARYGFTWRGMKLPRARELGIAGSELIILDLQSGEVVALRRGFIRTGDVGNSFTGVWWLGGHICPMPSGRPENYSYAFLTKVLQPDNLLSRRQRGN